MCGRFALDTTPDEIRDEFEVEECIEFDASYNIAPSNAVLAITSAKKTKLFRWGLIPSWAKDDKKYFINTRAETIDQKPTFKNAFQKHRCLIPATGFYEWKKNTGDNSKQPYLIRLQDEKLFSFAGIWETWKKGEDTIHSCSIITTEPNAVVKDIHNRMPVILAKKDYDKWLNGDYPDLKELLKPHDANQMRAHPVDTAVNNPKNKAFRPDLR